MADNVDITAGSGTSIKTDQVGSDHYQVVKLADGTADQSTVIAANDGVSANALRVVLANDMVDGTYAGDIKFGEALPTGSNAIGKLAANSGVDIGDVDVTSAVITGGGVADDATTPGNPIMIGGKAVETDGTDPTSVTAEADVAIARTDRNRRLLVNTMHPNSWIAYQDETSAQTDHEVKAAPGANLSLYITDIIVSNGATAGNIKFVRNTASSTQVGSTKYFAINGGMAAHFQTPIRIATNENFGFTSATVTTHSVEVHGYTAP